jgi:hypothetical protein
VFGYCERKQAGVAHRDLPRLHALIGQGMRNAEILERLDALTALQARTPSSPGDWAEKVPYGTVGSVSTPAGLPSAGPSNVEGRIADAVMVVKLDQQPQFILAAFPMGAVDIRELFESRTSPLVQLIEHPPEIRASGFDLTVDYSSHIVRGALRRSVYAEHKLLEMHRDGLVIFVNRGNGDGLCWGRGSAQAQENRINQLVLVENIYLFTQLVHRAYGGRVPANFDVSYRLSLIDVCSLERQCTLSSGPLDRWGYGSTHRENDPNMTRSLMVKQDTAAERSAFLLLSEVYAWFGFETTEIPYAKDTTDEGRVIDEEALLIAGKG